MTVTSSWSASNRSRLPKRSCCSKSPLHREDAVFKELRGVRTVPSGYAGDGPETADYRTVCSGRTNHVEAVEVRYDASQTTFGQLLKIHFSVAHDPTQFNRQGNDMGRQYRSAIFYADEEQRRIAEAYIRRNSQACLVRIGRAGPMAMFAAYRA